MLNYGKYMYKINNVTLESVKIKYVGLLFDCFVDDIDQTQSQARKIIGISLFKIVINLLK